MRTTSERNRQARTVGDAARKVGGYGELLRLERERRVIERRGGRAGIVRRTDGRYDCTEIPVEPTPMPEPKPSLLYRITSYLRA
jgi:hypothetical protein